MVPTPVHRQCFSIELGSIRHRMLHCRGLPSTIPPGNHQDSSRRRVLGRHSPIRCTTRNVHIRRADRLPVKQRQKTASWRSKPSFRRLPGHPPGQQIHQGQPLMDQAASPGRPVRPRERQPTSRPPVHRWLHPPVVASRSTSRPVFRACQEPPPKERPASTDSTALPDQPMASRHQPKLPC